MIFTTILAVLIAFFTLFIPGVLLALALLRKTELNLYEILIIGFIFGLIAPATLTWLESYLIGFISFFAFSLTLFLLNCLLLTIIGAILCFQQGVFKNFRQEFLPKHEAAEPGMVPKRKAYWWVWALVLLLMVSAFASRMLSIGIAPKFFEFDPYFDMIDTEYILTYGQQLLLDPSAYPAVAGGTNHRIEPLIPYLEAYWYDLSNSLSGGNTNALSTDLLSVTASWYPPIAAALLVFVIFLLVYHEYDEYIALIAAAITSMTPVLITTFIAGEQLVEPWGIFALFFFLAAYMLAVKNMKSKRLAIFAGFAFVSNFLGAHYYTVTTGVLVIYILLQGVIDVIRGTTTKEFYQMNAIVIAIIAVFFIIFLPYSSTLQNRVPSVLGIPIIIAGPLLALLFVAIMDYAPKLMKQRNIIFKELNTKTRLAWIVVVAIIGILLMIFTPLGSPIQKYLSLSTQFTTPSSPLFMTVEEFIPTGFTYNFGAQGLGTIGASIAGLPITIWLVSILALILIAISIYYRRSKTGILFMAMALPLMFAGFSEVKYLPHFGIAYIMLFAIAAGELMYLAEHNFKLKHESENVAEKEERMGILHEGNTLSEHRNAIFAILSVAMFFLSPVISVIFIIYLIFDNKIVANKNYFYALIAAFILIEVIAYFAANTIILGESNSYIQIASAVLVYSSNPTTACNTLSGQGNSLGYTLYCNTIPQYWLSAMAWIKTNAGPFGPRTLAWWDYGDWINWFGNGNAVLRGDNAVAAQDYAVAARYVLDQSSGYGTQSLANYMNGNETKYALFDQDLISKWQALDFLACININATSKAYAIAQGQAQNPPVPYALGTSQCEVQHDPEFALIPLDALIGGNSSTQSISYYCSMSNSTTPYIRSLLVVGGSLVNSSVCVNISPNAQGVLSVYNATTGAKMNAVIQSSFYQGVLNVQGTPFVQFLMIYLPNAANNTITNPPSKFYTSTYYKGFFLGQLPGFTQVYPNNATGINLVNGSYPIRIFALNNYTGGLPTVPPKPSYMTNNYTIP